jgi:signal recognition particle subunit SRP68
MAEAAMDVDDQAAQLPMCSFTLLQHIKSAQAQHGLRHGDYCRYR